ncbi:hypothetical protein [Leucobacter massiliensis]|uniref:FAD-dependent oxidoreductase n=1 Tax=Leucobacter massiliensis TaxID=1686285 RepID=A0A2S9QS79_9MICO|nr:hypothetical protein [Leucobacter massiliensis]PRI12428.1 hypothetical protein B4915_01805 [Leucobacter massiliensis]
MVDVCVLGDGLPELVAALDLAEVGLSVRVLTSAPEAAEAAWTALDPRGVPDPDGALRELLTHLAAPLAPGAVAHETVRAVERVPRPVLLRGPRGEWAPQSEPSVLGIPAVPVSTRAIALLGAGAALRAYLDRLKPVLTIGKTHSLGALVRSRMGKVALDRLVEPLVRERFGADADAVEVPIAAPGLNEALTRVGSLSGAVLALADRDVARETRVAPAGGWLELREALLQRLALYDVGFAPCTAGVAHRSEQGEWELTGETPSGAEYPAGSAPEAVAHPAEAMRARALVIGASAASIAVPGLAQLPAVLAQRRLRVSGRIPIEAPALPAEPGDLDAVETIESPEGERWSLRLERDAEGWSARLAGPVLPAEATAPSPAAARERLQAVLAAAGLRAREPRGADAAGERAPQQGVSTAAHGSIGQRDAMLSALRELHAEEPSVVLVGSELHGGDLAQALAAARSETVQLRRRLTGISG